MQKMKRKIVLVLITLFLVIICNNCSFAANSVTNRASSNTSQSNSISDEENETEDENAVSNETSENEIIEEHMELSYPDIKASENNFGPLTMEQVIGGAAALIALVGIILAISLYARSREDYEDDWNYEPENNLEVPDSEEPKAIKELKKEENIEQPKAVQEMEDQKKIEEIKKAREEENKDNINEIQKETDVDENKEDTNSFNYKHQKALDDFYNYAEEIKKEEKKPKRGKGKHSM